MPWPFLLLSFIAFLTSQASSYPEYPSFNYQENPINDDKIPEPEETFEAKRALTLLSRLAPIRSVLRQQAEDRHYDSRAYRPRMRSYGGDQRAPGGPLRFGRRR